MSNSQEYIVGLERLIKSGATNEDIHRWYSLSKDRYSNSVVKRTLKKANREDLISYLIEEVDIDLGDTVKSRTTARVGEVVKIHQDGDTISVRWTTGGIQPLSKESVYIFPKDGNVEMSSDLKKVHTEGDESNSNERNVFNTNRDVDEK